MFPLLCYVFGRNTSSYCCSLFPNTCILYLDINLLYELLMCAVFYLTELFISALLLSIMRKSIQTKSSERRKPDFWAWQTLNACSNQCLLQELQVLSTAEEGVLSICWEVGFLLTYTSLSPVPCRHGRYFLEKCRIGTYSLYLFTVCFLRSVSSLPFLPLLQKTWQSDSACGVWDLGRKDRENMDSLCKRQS